MYHTVISVDANGIIEYWSAEPEYGVPDNLEFTSKLDTDLFTFAKVIIPLLILTILTMNRIKLRRYLYRSHQMENSSLP